MMPEDTRLLQAYALDRSEAAFAGLVRLHIDVVYGTALRRVRGNHHLAEEVVQQVFTALARKAPALATHPALVGWLHTSTQYAATSLLRREARRSRREQEAHDRHMQDTDTEAPAWAALQPVIDQALDHLAEVDRHAVLLRFFSGLTFEEVGERLGLSDGAARQRVNRALEALRRQLGRRGITTTAAALGVALTGIPAVATPAALVADVAGAAAAGGTGATGLTVFMSTLKLKGACALMGAATLGTALLLTVWSAQRREAAQLETLAHLAQAQQKRLAEMSRAVSAAPAGRAGGAVSTGNGSVRILDQQHLEEMLLTNPAYAPFLARERRLRVERECRAFFTQQGYPPERVEAAKQALVLLFEAQEANWRAARKGNPAAAFQPDATLAAESRELAVALRDCLGTEQIAELQQHLLARQQMPTMRNVALDLADTGCALDEMQERSLVATLAEGFELSVATDTRIAFRQVDQSGLSGRERWQIDQARAFLSEAQLQGFAAYLREERERLAVYARVAASVPEDR